MYYIDKKYNYHETAEYYDDTIIYQHDIVHQPTVYYLANYLIKTNNISTVIDIGSGNGEKLSKIKADNKIGYDFGSNLDFCRIQYPDNQWNEINLEDCEKISNFILPQEKSVIICSDVIEHLVDPIPLLFLFKRAYEKGHIIITSTPDRCRVRGVDHAGPPPNRSHIREWAMDEYKLLLSDFIGTGSSFGYGINNTDKREYKTIISVHDKILSPYKLPLDKAIQRPLAIITSYNDQDIIYSIIEESLKEECDVYLIDNWSSDGTWEIIEKLKCKYPDNIKTERWPADGPSDNYEWKMLLDRKSTIAADNPEKWIIHQDSDEYRKSFIEGQSLGKTLNIIFSHGYDLVDFTLTNFYPHDECFNKGIKPEEYFKFYKFGDRPGHFSQCKAWYQKDKVLIDLSSTGGHVAKRDEGFKIYPYKLMNIHFPLRSSIHAKNKILIERGERGEKERNSNGWHTHYIKIAESGLFLPQLGELKKGEPLNMSKEFFVEMISDYNKLKHDYDLAINKTVHEFHTLI